MRTILRNEIYTGTFIGQTTRRIIPGQKKVVYVDGREQAYIKNHHEAIVTYDEWEKAQEVIIKINPNYRAPYKRHALKGKVICGNCGHVMLYTENMVEPSHYQCSYQQMAGWHAGQDIGCTKEVFDEGILNRLVFDGLKKWFETVKGADVKVKEFNQRKWEKLKELGREAEKIQSELFEQQNRKVRLYEDYTDGKVSREDFVKQKEQLSAEIDALRGKLDGLHRQETVIKKNSGTKSAEFEQLVEQVDIFKDEIILTKTMADVFVEKVVIKGKFEIEVVWEWADAVESVLRGLEDEAELDNLGGPTEAEMDEAV